MNLGNILLYLTSISCITSVILNFRTANIKLSLGHSFAQFSLLTIALLKLINAYINTDYNFTNVLENSHEFIPMIYKITGVWGNHEGSMLLLVWSFSFISIIFGHFSKFDINLTARVLSLQSFILLCLLSIVLFTSNPFHISKELFPTGKGFNPLLQDIGLTIHPPILYLGYGCTSIPFSISIAALLQQPIMINRSFLVKLHTWLLPPWALLSCGIGLGSWWAYRELGWGGFWFWDPVENVSLIVWIGATISLHALRLALNHSNYYRWLLLSNLVTFLLSIFGMFLVRSGILSSVHSFAFDQERGQLIFTILLLLTILSISLFIVKYKTITKNSTTKIATNLSLALVTNNILLALACTTIILGIIYPVLHDFIFNKVVSVTESFYISTLSLFIIPLIYLGGMYSSQSLRRLMINVLCSTIVILIINSLAKIDNYLSIIYMHASVLMLISTLVEFKITARKNHKNFAMLFGHLGFALIIFGGSLYYTYRFEQTLLVTKNTPQTLRNYQLTLKALQYSKVNNYLSRKAVIEVKYKDKILGLTEPEIRFYPVEKTFTVESALIHTYLGDIYLTLGELDKEVVVIKMQLESFIYLIWLGVLFMVCAVSHFVLKNDDAKIIR